MNNYLKNGLFKHCALIVLLFNLNQALAQEVQITGTVTDANGQAIPSVNVVIKGTTNGVVTDFDGNYAINANPSDVLVFSSVGFSQKEMKVDNQTSINMSLQEDVSQLDEVVVTALGIKREKKALGYATAEVAGDKINQVKATNNFVNGLSGKVAGVQISSPSSQPGSGTRIVIRGGSSITGNNQPLLVVNGIPFDAANGSGVSGLADIDPNSIESLSVLKGAAASALYGSEAGNGVILITTKSGSFDQKPVITVSNSSSFDKIYEVPHQKLWSQGFWNGEEYEYVDGETSFTSQSWGPRIADVPGAIYYDRWKIFKTGFTNQSSVSASGGNDKATYFVSYSNLQNNGILEPIGFDRNSITANTSFKFTPKLTVSSNVLYSIQNNNRLEESNSNSSFMNTIMAQPNTWNPYPVRDADGNLRSYRGGARDPALWLLDNSRQNNIRDRFASTIIVDYKILPTLTFRSTTGFSTSSTYFESYFNKGGYASIEGGYNTQEDFSRDIESTETLTYDNRFGDFSINVLAGHNIVENKYRRTVFTGNGLVIPGIYNTSNVSDYTSYNDKYAFRSYSIFGQAVIGYKNLLYYTVTGRNDWASSVADSFFYPSHSLGFVFSELLPKSDFLTFGKLRASYAKVGAPSSSYARSIALVEAGGRGVTWPFNGQRSYLSSDKVPNPGLTNEFKSEVELGAELKLLKNRLGIDFSYYHNWSDNQILSEQFLSSTGYTYGTVNIGGITHKGVELGITATPVQTDDFAWDLSLNFAKDNSNVDQLGLNNEPISVGSYGSAVVGEPYPVIYGTGFLRDNQGRLVLDDTPGDSFGRPLADNTQNQILGKTAPDWTGSFRTTLAYKNLSLSAQLDVSKGGYLYSETDHYLTYYGMAKHQENRPDDNMYIFDGVMGHYDFGTNQVVVTNETPQPTTYSLYWQDVAQRVLEDNVMPKDYIKLREVQLSYKVPPKYIAKLGMQDFDIALSGRNLWRKFNDDYEGPDPEINSDGITNGNAYQVYSLPATQTYSITLTAKF